jgi:Protein of unknown function (DUF2905)
MRAVLILAGVLLLALGLAWPWLARIGEWLPFGALPGDIRIERPGFRLFAPLGSLLLVSALLSLALTLILWLWRR